MRGDTRTPPVVCVGDNPIRRSYFFDVLRAACQSEEEWCGLFPSVVRAGATGRATTALAERGALPRKSAARSPCCPGTTHSRDVRRTGTPSAGPLGPA